MLSFKLVCVCLQVRLPMKQWMLRITAYAGSVLDICTVLYAVSAGAAAHEAVDAAHHRASHDCI
jgi:hypothetical protein